MKSLLEYMANDIHFSSEVLLIFRITFVLLTCGILIILNLFASRIIKSYYQKRESFLRTRYQQILNKVIVNEMYSEAGGGNKAFEFYMAELRLICENSRFSRQVLINQILEIKKNLTGNSSSVLVKTFYEMLLFNDSLRKLKSFAWQKKALGIRELAEMGYRESMPLIIRSLNDNNQTLRQESFMALVRLEDRPLSFFAHYDRDISLWMRINIYNYLSKLDHRKLPVFSQWFNHRNMTVRLFSISMARQFKQTTSIPGLVDMLYSDNAKIVGLAVAALGEMEAYQHRQEIVTLASHVWRFEKLAIRVVQCLGRIGDTDMDIPVVGKFLSHPSYAVRFEAVSALKKLGANGERLLRDFNTENNRGIQNLLNHFDEPLLA